MMLGGPAMCGAASVPTSLSPGLAVAADFSELEELHKIITEQTEKISQLTKELANAKESEGKLRMEADVARAEAARLVEELRREKQARERLEGATTSAFEPKQQDLQGSRGLRSSSAKPSVRRSMNGSIGGTAASMTPGSARSGRQELSVGTGRKSPDAGRSASNLGAVRRGASPVQAASSSTANMSKSEEKRPSMGHLKDPKDEIDARLQDFVDRSECSLIFKRLNKGFYTVKRVDASDLNHVEVSIVNGKLMVRLDSSTTDPGWNNGKLGSVEKFVAFYSGA